MSDDPFDLQDLYDNAPFGYVTILPDGVMGMVNQTLAGWLGRPVADLLGRPVTQILSFGGRIAFETHLAPMLRLHGRAEEIALDLVRADGSKISVTASVIARRNAAGEQIAAHFAMVKATERRSYERALLADRSRAQATLQEQEEVAILREQFIAVLGHDLRNPLGALISGVRLLGRETLSERGRNVLLMMTKSADRAVLLIENILDFARGRLGEGLILARDAREPLTPVLEQVVGEVALEFPDCDIRTDFAIAEPLDCDRQRLGQLVANLLSNAVTHGAPDIPIEVTARTGEDHFALTVSNGGAPIPPDQRAKLFQPFFRGAVRHSRHGLGLGLFIVNEIAKAHGGTMEVRSDEQETSFVFMMPIQRIPAGTSA